MKELERINLLLLFCDKLEATCNHCIFFYFATRIGRNGKCAKFTTKRITDFTFTFSVLILQIAGRVTKLEWEKTTFKSSSIYLISFSFFTGDSLSFADLFGTLSTNSVTPTPIIKTNQQQQQQNHVQNGFNNNPQSNYSAATSSFDNFQVFY